MEKTEKKKKSVVKIIVNILLWVFLAFAILTTVYAFIMNMGEGLPHVGDTVFMAVKSQSMEPTIMTGDMILTKLVKDNQAYEFQKNDVVSYWAYNSDGTKYINTHRIVEVYQDDNGTVTSYLTKGDNNEIADNYTLLPEDILCYWSAFGYQGGKISGLGSVFNFLNTQLGFGICIVIPLILFFAYELYKFIASVVAIKNKDKKVISVADEELIKQRAIEEYLRQQEAAKVKAASEAAPEPTVTPEAEAPADFQVEETVAKAEETVDQAQATAESVSGEAENAVKDAAQEVAETVAETAEATVETVTEAAENTVEAAEETAENIEEATADTENK